MSKETNIVTYRPYVAGEGWRDYVPIQTTCGSVGESKQLEAFQLQIENADQLGIVANCYMGGKWLTEKHQREVIGNPGCGEAIQMISLNLFGEKAKEWDIWYNVHVSNMGWIGFCKNGEQCGVKGDTSKFRVEAIQVFLSEKGRSWFGIDNLNSFEDRTPAPPTEGEDAKRLRIIRRAQSHVGYLSYSSTDSKFGRELLGANAGNWCAFFVMSVFNNEGLKSSIPYSSYCPTIVDTAKYWGTWHTVGTYTPKTGDLVLYDFNYNKISDHVGIVETVINPTHIIAIEGNTGNPVGVYRKDRSSGILGFVTPKF